MLHRNRGKYAPITEGLQGPIENKPSERNLNVVSPRSVPKVTPCWSRPQKNITVLVVSERKERARVAKELLPKVKIEQEGEGSGGRASEEVR